ncbi:hypothetical protein [Cupriavidus sp. UYPR2.512]|uniref:hypothetical protein n=1 Tax=Cupriavidus sp. UYPR2.512 TaxID=1080187 RepID=UPI0012F7470B|nr:hypothetical protein [Cupriavidus sp. UYPR2.512]UIF88726.1 hypothetical protein KAF44_25860 [Cupriavidus necator]
MLERLYEQQLPKGAVGVLAATLLNCWLEKDGPAQKEKVSDLQLREILVRSDNVFRELVIRHLAMWSKKAAGTMDDQALRFIDKVWPLQSIVRTTEMTARLVGLALAIPARFTEAVTLLQRRLVQASDRVPGSLFYQIDERIVADHCPALVDLLWRILPNSSTLWGDGIENLIQRLEVEPSAPEHETLAELRRRAKYRL